MSPQPGDRVALRYNRRQRVHGRVLECFEDEVYGPSVRIRADGGAPEDVWEAPIYDCGVETTRGRIAFPRRPRVQE